MTKLSESHRSYNFHTCRDCEQQFFVQKSWDTRIQRKKNLFCPMCGENMYTEKVGEMDVRHPLQYRRRWTTVEIDILKSGLQAGYTLEKIAKSLEGRSAEAIRKKWRKLEKEGAIA